MAGEVWKLNRGFFLIPPGKGYFTIQLECEEDKVRIWGGGTWIFDGQWLRLTPWVQNFSPSTQKNSCALVWIRFPRLGMEYWEEKSLLSIARTAGHPVQVDENTLNTRTGFYASFMQEVVIGHLPKFCNNCKVVGHVVYECRELTKMREEEEKKNEQKGDFEVSSNLDEGVKSRACTGFDVTPEQCHFLPDTLAIMPVVAETWADLTALDEKDGLSEDEELGVCDKVDDGFVTSILYWNCRGIGNPKRKNTLKKLIVEDKPSIFALAEPKVDACISNVPKLGLKEYEVNLICNEHDGVPNLWILWKLGCTKPVVLSSSDQQIAVWFEDFMLTFIHANCDIARRRTLWKDLGNINGNMAPQLVVGDFNVILSSGEKKGGVPSSNTAISNFQNCVDALELIQYTWYNMQRGNSRILVLLDRIFMNSKWVEKFENWSYKVHPRVNFGHSPLVGKCVGISHPSNNPFKFCKMSLGHEGFKLVVEEAWNSGNVEGPLLSLSRKLKAVKVAIRDWTREVFGHSDRNIKKLNAEIEAVHIDMEQDVSNDCLSAQLTVLNNSLNKAMLYQEIL
ncbi:hypothetical protein GIB67_036493 [Kingdonia uniflora]|uniref:DUF4283 domain-containing protein n=1 Tax=Kingdonia uniflora TaxID=39325 RepID=A0A7J7P814_9MAGN|nr:hypothetical protein GIB67_036493 [Kingdonia uniflora]